MAALLVTGSAAADPGFAWLAPASCPDASEVLARVEQRFGGALEGNLYGIEIEITKDGTAFVARIDARAITVANDIRTLRSRRCDALADAVAVIVARLANEVRASRRTAAIGAPTAIAALAAPPTVALVDTPAPEAAATAIDDLAPAPRRPSRWGGGVQLLGLSGIGALPQINLGGELAGYVRREARFASLGLSRWVPQSASLAPGAPGGVEVRLDIMTVRAGWGPEALPLRAWLTGELGRIQGTGVGLDAERTASTRWIALGGGFGVAWPMTRHARLIGTFELAFPLQRPRYMLEAGHDLFQPAAAAARCALGLEVGWP